jgi:hypothetical protein
MNTMASLRGKNLTYKNSTSANNKQRGPCMLFWLNSSFEWRQHPSPFLYKGKTFLVIIPCAAQNRPIPGQKPSLVICMKYEFTETPLLAEDRERFLQ